MIPSLPKDGTMQKTWSIRDAAKMMEVSETYVKECVKNNILIAGPRGGVTEESLDKYFEDALFTPEEAADALGIEIGIVEDCIKDGFLPTYQAWKSTVIRGKDLDKLYSLLEMFIREETRQERLTKDINNRAKWIAASQGNRCYICKNSFKGVPEYWLNHETENINLFALHAICKNCADNGKKISNN